MLKEAIAEAKTIKETAIANAKAALEEAFTPQLTAMFAERLNEDEEEEMKKENYHSMEEEELEEDFNLEEILAELSKTDEADDMVSEEDMDKMDEDLMLEEMSDEEIEELVMKVIDDMIETGKLMPGEGEEEEEEDMENMDDMEDMDGEEVEIGDEEDVELDELLNELMGSEKEEVKEISRIGVDEKAFKGFVDEYIATMAKKGKTVTPDDLSALHKGFYKFLALTSKDKEGKTISTGAGAVSTGGGSTYKANETIEMEETINELKNELNEVNLLNAKLLYTNKIFKTKNLTESEKVKVLNTFDKAETVKEVKLVFETLTESFKAVAKKAPIKESLGSASRSIASTQTKQPIIEVNDAFARMQKLAGLRK